MPSPFDEFYEQRVSAARAVPPDQRPADVAVFLEAFDIGNAAAALLPMPDPQATEAARLHPPQSVLAMGRIGLQLFGPKPQPVQDDQLAAVLGYLFISYTMLPGQPRPLNHPRFMDAYERERLYVLLGGYQATQMELEVTITPDNTIDDSRRLREIAQWGAGSWIKPALDGSGDYIATISCLESLLAPPAPLRHHSPPQSLRNVVQALLLACLLGLQSKHEAASRILRTLAPTLDSPDKLASLDAELAAAQQRRREARGQGTDILRLPSAQQLQLLWLRMRLRAAPPGDDAALSLTRRIVELDGGNTRSWQDLGRTLSFTAQQQLIAAHSTGGMGGGQSRYHSQNAEVARIWRRGLGLARDQGNAYYTAFFCYELVIDSVRLSLGLGSSGCSPAEAAGLLREGEAAWQRLRKRLPQEWVDELHNQRRTALALREALETHEKESPQAWKPHILNPLLDRVAQQFNEAELRAISTPQHRTCMGCGHATLAIRTCGACKAAYYCSRECQTRDWKRHRPACKAAQAAKAASGRKSS